MTIPRVVDFINPTNSRSREVPEGLPALDKYKANGDKSAAIVIDAGSWQYRAGYSSKDTPACKMIGCRAFFLISTSGV